jgi:hypothetical protein
MVNEQWAHILKDVGSSKFRHVVCNGMEAEALSVPPETSSKNWDFIM